MYLACQQERFGLPSTGRLPGSGRSRSRGRLGDHGAWTWSARPDTWWGVPSGAGAGRQSG